MSISAVSTNSYSMNASYPKYVENKKRSGTLLLMGSGTLGVGVAALHFSKSSFAKKNPWLLATGAALSLLGTVVGVSNLSSASKDIKNLANQSQQAVETKNLEYAPEKDTLSINKKNEEQERAKQAINHMAMSNPLINPTGYLVHATNPTVETSPLDSPVSAKIK